MGLEEEMLKINSNLSKCQGLLEGIYLGMSYEDYYKQGVLNSLNEAVQLLQESRDKLTIKIEPKY